MREADRTDGASLRILMVHDYYGGDVPSGENSSFEQEASLLEERGHHVVRFTRHSDDLDITTWRGKANLARETIWSEKARREIAHIVSQEAIDVLHVQNTFPQVSPAALRVGGAAVVQSLRNYRMMCINGALFRKGEICVECVGRSWPWRGILHGSYRGDRLQSSVVAGMIAVHRAMATWRRYVDLFIATSGWLRDIHVEHGVKPEQIVVKDNLVRPDPGVGSHEGGFVLYAGRLSEEKGLRVLCRAMQLLAMGNGPIPELVIVGDGPMRDLISDRAERYDGTTYLGYRSHAETMALMREAVCVVAPSIWHEPFGRSVAEAFAAGTPVVASSIGGLAEIVEDGVNGWLVEPGNPHALAAALAGCMTVEGEAYNLSARATYEDRFSPAAVYERMIEIYLSAIDIARARRSRSLEMLHDGFDRGYDVGGDE